MIQPAFPLGYDPLDTITIAKYEKPESEASDDPDEPVGGELPDLGLSEKAREVLASEGIHTLEDVAEIEADEWNHFTGKGLLLKEIRALKKFVKENKKPAPA